MDEIHTPDLIEGIFMRDGFEERLQGEKQNN
jgi:hypothetical protein